MMTDEIRITELYIFFGFQVRGEGISAMQDSAQQLIKSQTEAAKATARTGDPDDSVSLWRGSHGSRGALGQ